MYNRATVESDLKKFYRENHNVDKYEWLNQMPHSDTFIEDTSRYVWFMSGIPGSGKSTLANFIAHELDNTVVLSRDKFRGHLRGIYQSTDYFPTDARTELRLWTEFISSFIAANPQLDVIIDQTTLNSNTFDSMKDSIIGHLSDSQKANTIFGIIFKVVPLNVCLERNQERRNRGFEYVPEASIEKMYDQFLWFYYHKKSGLPITINGNYLSVYVNCE